MLPEAKLHDFLSVTLDSFTNLCMSHFLTTMALECNQSQLIQSHKALIKMYLTKHLFINVMEASRARKYNCIFLFLVRYWGVAYNKEYLVGSIITLKHSLMISCYRYSWLIYCIIVSIFKHKKYINKYKLIA